MISSAAEGIRLRLGLPAKDFSFTDCTSFTVMGELRLRKALTLDHHFAQMSFEVVPSV